jgi:hypothetical protein
MGGSEVVAGKWEGEVEEAECAQVRRSGIYCQLSAYQLSRSKLFNGLGKVNGIGGCF